MGYPGRPARGLWKLERSRVAEGGAYSSQRRLRKPRDAGDGRRGQGGTWRLGGQRWRLGGQRGIGHRSSLRAEEDLFNRRSKEACLGWGGGAFPHLHFEPPAGPG